MADADLMALAHREARSAYGEEGVERLCRLRTSPVLVEHRKAAASAGLAIPGIEREDSEMQGMLRAIEAKAKALLARTRAALIDAYVSCGVTPTTAGQLADAW